MIIPVETLLMYVLTDLHIDHDHEREEDGAYLWSVVDLRETGDNYLYFTIVWTDNGDSENVAVVLVEDKPRKVVTEVIMRTER
jgi:hypothetical protein